MPKFQDLPREKIIELSTLYEYEEFSISLKNKKYMTQQEFLEIVLWKSKRPKRHYVENDDQFIKEVTKIAFCSNVSERLRIEVLQLLNGVSYPVASTLLHFGLDSEKYPIIDFRALWSLYGTNQKEIKYDFEFWDKYRIDCIKLAKMHQITLRTLDKALWQFSKFYQKDV